MFLIERERFPPSLWYILIHLSMFCTFTQHILSFCVLNFLYFFSKSNQFLMTLIGLPLILLKSQQLIIIIIMSLAYESVKYLEGSFFKNVVDKNEPFFLVECDEYSQLSSWNSHCWRQGHTFYWQLSFEVSRGSKSGNRKTMKQNI